MKTQLSICFCYARKDRAFLDAIKTHLSPLLRETTAYIWHDADISPGSDWEAEIKKQISAASIILLLITPRFMASDYCYGKELVWAMERHERGETRVIPIILRPTDWRKAPFARLQALPANALPVTKWRNRDDALLSIVDGIKIALRLRYVLEEKEAFQRIEQLTPAKTPPRLGAPNLSRVRIGTTETKREGSKIDPIGRLHQTPLVGRKAELARLSQFLRERETSQRGQQLPCGLVLTGEAGIGKTRLAEELSHDAQQRNWSIIWSRSYIQECQLPYGLWIHVVRQIINLELGSSLAKDLPPYYAPLQIFLPEIIDLLPNKSTIATSSLPGPLQLQEAVCTLLIQASKQAPLLIVLDDFHWIDSNSSELLAYLVRHMGDFPIVFVCTCREAELPGSHPLRSILVDLQREQAIEQIVVGPLNSDEICQLINYLPEQIVKSISARVFGNPFFAEELARVIYSHQGAN